MSKIWGGVLTITGVIACPCHLPLTFSLLVGILGGTGIGGFASLHRGLVYGVFTGYFLLAIGVGLYLLSRKRAPLLAATLKPSSVTRQRSGG